MGSLGCGKKNRYLTREAADSVLRQRQPHEPATLYRYECTICFGWHLTKLKPKEYA